MAEFGETAIGGKRKIAFTLGWIGFRCISSHDGVISGSDIFLAFDLHSFRGMTVTDEQTVRNIAVANPAATRVFETFGIDYCCGGNLSLSAACARANASIESVAEALQECERTQEADAPDDATLGDLTRYIVARHHEFVRRESQRIQALLVKVDDRHGRVHTELSRVRALFAALSQELNAHMTKEERILFPYIEALGGQSAPSACFDSVESPIAVMIADHEDAGAILLKIRTLTNGHTAPAGACSSFRALYAALDEFERDLHRHVHLENNILFPRAISAECELRRASASPK